MKRFRIFQITSILVLLIFCLGNSSISAGEDNYPLVDFKATPTNCSVYGNAAMELLASGGQNGDACVKITLGSINDQNYGSFQITRISGIDKLDKESFNALSFWIKGDGAPGAFVVLLREGKDFGGKSWVWNGPRWQAEAQIHTDNAVWHKVICRLQDFTCTKEGGTDSINIQHLAALEFSIGAQLKVAQEKAACFEVELIQLEKANL